MPRQLDAKIYSLTFKLLFTSGVGIESVVLSLPGIESAVSVGGIELAASSWRHRVGPFPSSIAHTFFYCFQS